MNGGHNLPQNLPHFVTLIQDPMFLHLDLHGILSDYSHHQVDASSGVLECPYQEVAALIHHLLLY